MGGDLDGYNSYAQRGNLPLIEDLAASAISMFPFLSRLRLWRDLPTRVKWSAL